MEGKLVNLFQAKLVEGSSGPRDAVSGTLGIFSYSGAGDPGDLCLFVPDSPERLGSKAKLRPGPGVVEQDGSLLRFTVGETGASYAWELVDPIADKEEIRAFLDFAEKRDRIIRHLLKGARLLGE